MMKKTNGRGFGSYGSPPESKPEDADLLLIQYGHNVEIGRVVMLFDRLTPQVILTPEQAEEAAKNLLFEAEAARGGRTTKVS